MLRNKIKKQVIIGLLLIVLLVVGFVVYRKNSEPELKLEGWINCMPAPDSDGSYQDKLCRQAEKQNYPLYSLLSIP